MGTRYEHYVPKYYLKGFLDPDKVKRRQYLLWVYRSGRAPQLRPYTRVGGEYGFYDHENGTELEGRLAAIEDQAARLQRILIGRGQLTGEDRLIFANYVGLMATRGRTFFDMTNRITARVHEVLAGDPVLDPHAIAPAQPTRAWVLNEMIQCGSLFGQLFTQMTWWVMQAPTDSHGFVTSDTPVMLSEPKELVRTETGMRYSNRAWFTFPLSSTYCLHGHFRSGGDQYGRMRPFEFRNVNHHTIGRAEREVYAATNNGAIQNLVGRLTRPSGIHEGALQQDLAFFRQRSTA